jgi:L-ascorbate metabolism protein UlaG (beta-lactamase superfamily)
MGTIEGPFSKINEEGSHDLKGLKIRGIPAYHDGSEGNERGNILIFVIETEGLRLMHVGDLGHLLNQNVIDRIG